GAPGRPGDAGAREGGDGGGPAAAARGDEAADRGRDAPGARGDPRRGRGAQPRRGREGDAQVARRQGPAPPDRRGDRRARLLGAGAERLAMAVAHRMYARALYGAAKEKDRIQQVREELGDFVAIEREVPELRQLLRNPQLDHDVKAAALEELVGGEDELIRNFLMLLVEKGRAGEVEEIAREFERLAAAEAGILDVELTTAVELSDQAAQDVIQQIEKASGRKVEA